MARSPLRRRLFALVAAVVVPLGAMAGAGLYALARQQETQARRVGVELARSVATFVDSELRSSVAALEAVATNPALDTGDLTVFLERARRVVDLRPEWTALVVYDAAGTPLADTRFPGPGSLTPPPDREGFEQVLRTRASRIGTLLRTPGEQWLFPVEAPVVRDGTVQYVLTVLARPAAIRELLLRQQLAPDWLISIVDSNGAVLATSRRVEDQLGQPLPRAMRGIIGPEGVEGFGTSTGNDGEALFLPYARLESTGWIAVIGIPATIIETATRQALGAYGGAVVLALAFAVLGALWVARGITRPIAELRAAAEALGRRQSPQAPRTSIQEIHDVGAALAAAADERDRGEAQREELLKMERLAREGAEAADRAKEQFMTLLSHELRTPLNAVYGWARMLQRGPVHDDAFTTRATDAIVRNADIQIQLIDDLLDFSRISSGKMRFDVHRLDPADAVRGAVDAVRPAADAKGIRLSAVAPPGAGPVNGDPARLQQVVWNLLSNAVKFTPAGGRVDVQLQSLGDRVRIVVRDTGQGIAPELLPHVFERFRQGDSSSTRAHGGLGLGLALVRHLVELHGGHVEADSAGRGQGATFIVTLPVAGGGVPAGPAAAPEPSAPMPEKIGVVRLDGLRVLAIDDDPEALVLAEAILTRAGATVRTSSTVADALGLMRRWRPDVLVSDIEMPGEDGYGLIRKVRALPAGEGGAMPAIALSAYGRPQDRARSLASGFNMHVPKPVDPGELTAIIADVAGQPWQPGA